MTNTIEKQQECALYWRRCYEGLWHSRKQEVLRDVLETIQSEIAQTTEHWQWEQLHCKAEDIETKLANQQGEIERLRAPLVALKDAYHAAKATTGEVHKSARFQAALDCCLQAVDLKEPTDGEDNEA